MLVNIFYLYGMQAVNYIIPLIVLPYLIRVLGPEQYGELGLVLSIIQYLSLVTDYGFNLYSSGRIARSQDSLFEIKKIFSQTILAKCFIFIITMIVMSILIFIYPKLYDLKDLILIALLQVIGTIFTPIWLFQGLEIMKKFATINIISKLSCLPFIFYFVKTKDDLPYAIFFQVAVYFISAMLSLIQAHTLGIQFIKVKIVNILMDIKESTNLFIGTLSISLYTLSTPILLGIFSGNYELGIYTAADKIRAALLGIFVILGNVFYPRIQKLMSTNKLEAFVLIKQILKYQIIVCFILTIIFYMVAPLIVKYYLGNEFRASLQILWVMGPMIILIPTSIILSNYILLPLGYKKMFGVVPIITASVHLTYAIYLIKNYNSIGASVSILITEVFSLLILTFVNYKLGNFKKIFKREAGTCVK